MKNLDMGAAWDDAVALLRAHPALTGAIAALLLFLPALVVYWLGPPQFEPVPGSTPQQMFAGFSAYFQAALPWLFVQALLSTFGTVAILRLWLGGAGISVGEALGFAATVFPTIFALQILQSLILFVGFLLLVIPGLYLTARLALTTPFVAHEGIRNPLKALEASWQATRDNGWRILLFLLLIFVVFAVLSAIIGLLTGVLAGLGAAGAMISGAVTAAVGAVMGLVSAAVTAAIYRQLVRPGKSAVFS